MDSSNFMHGKLLLVSSYFFPLVFFLKISFTSLFCLILKLFLGDCEWNYLSDFFFDVLIIYRNTTNKHSWTCSLWTPYPSTEILAHSCLLSFPLPMAWKWNQPRCLSNDELAVKTWYIYMMEFYLTIKNEIAGKSTELENILLSEIVQAQKDKHCVYTIIRCS